MPVPIALMAAGTALQIMGRFRANMDQATAELQNAEFYRQQADLAREAMFRKESITANEYEYRKGAQLSAFARGNVDISGSASTLIASTLADKVTELIAIKRQGEMDVHLALARGRQAEATAGTLRDPFYNLMQAGGTLFSNLANASDSNVGNALYKWAGGTPSAATAKTSTVDVTPSFTERSVMGD